MENKKIELGNPIRKDKFLMDGKTVLRDVYLINIKNLYYNDKNGRIASYIAGYNNEHPDIKLSELTIDNYNDIIMKYIKKSGSAAKYKSTLESIRNVGQQKCGIILEDGRVIDGNRRFTCLRDLYEETANEKFMYFECFVLPLPKTENDWAKIKGLELFYQFGEDVREDYDPIDKLVDTYIYLVNPKTKLFTPEEYRARTNNQISLQEIKLRMIKAEIMYDYLKFINKEGRYDYARDMKLDGPLQELANKKKKLSVYEWDFLAPILYNQMQHVKGDKTREIRRLIKIYDEKPEEFQKIADKIFEVAMIEEEIEQRDYKGVAEIEKNVQIQKTLSEVDKHINTVTTNIARTEARDKQHKILEDIIKKISTIDRTAIRMSNESEKKMILKDIINIEKELNKLKEVIGNVK